MRFRLPRVLELRCTNQCSRIGPKFSPRLLPTMSSCIHEAASDLQFIQLHITTKPPAQCVLMIVISRRPLNPVSPLFAILASNVVLIRWIIRRCQTLPVLPQDRV